MKYENLYKEFKDAVPEEKIQPRRRYVTYKQWGTEK